MLVSLVSAKVLVMGVAEVVVMEELLVKMVVVVVVVVALQSP